MNYYPQFAGRFQVLLDGLKGRQVVVIGHQRPDGDCIGSQVALCRVLRSQGIDAVCMNPDPVPRRTRAFVGDTPFLLRDQMGPESRVALFVDCADHGRAGEKIRAAYPKPMACFDHHISNDGFARFNFVDTGSAATAEILAGVLLDSSFPIDPVAAQALYVGIMTDTGQFRFPSTSKRVFQISGDLLRLGAKPDFAAAELFERESMGKLKLIREFIGSLKLEFGGRACIGVLPSGVFEQVGASVEDTEGLVDYARSIEGVEIAVLIEERPGVIKASLRARSSAMRVDSLAGIFGGGGHANAAGLNCADTLDAFYPKLVAAIGRRLAEADAARS
jgi:phosphoesterase RecJ-like protein